MSTAKQPVSVRFFRLLILGMVVLGSALGGMPPARADVKSVMPDFYAEPGLNPFRDPVQANANEVIDPFSGGLHLSHVDTFIPGNGGLDIKIQRVYNSSNVYLSRRTPTNGGPYPTELAPRTATGLGWTLHFGRVLRSGTLYGICTTGTAAAINDTLDNPVLELPDGSQQILFVNATSFSALWVTKEQWVAYCIGGGKGLLVISPDGTKYTMDYLKSGGTYYGDVNRAWYTTQIEDRNGNWLRIYYNTAVQSVGIDPVFSQITSSDNRNVSFSYSGTNNAQQVLLTSISANGQTWSYNYTPATYPYNGSHYQLTSVSRPDGLDWRYSYHALAVTQPGDRLLDRVTYPHGATTSYDYGYECFNAAAAYGYQCSSTNSAFFSLVVVRKTNGGRDVTSGSWNYSYSPSTSEDVTTVTFPGGRYVYRHFGSRLVYNTTTVRSNQLWQIGLLKEKATYDGGSLVNREVYTWSAPYLISNEQYVRPPYDGSDFTHLRYYDDHVYAPVLVRKDIVRDGTTYTTSYSNFDASYNPQTVTESGQAGRTTSVSYFPRAANQNIVRLVKDEVLGGRTIYRTFDGNGNPTQVVRNGVRETYTYDASGNLASRTNARGYTWSYGSYARGIPQTENHPAGVSISRNVNGTGTIASVTNGRRHTTSYSYNGMNQLTAINPPAGSSVSISWGSSGRTVRRGSYSQAVTFDGFGRPSAINTSGVTQNINYNALGFKSFESYYSSSSGDSYGTDVLGRVTAINHADGTGRRMNYGAGNSVTVTNERGYGTTFSYRSFGDPDNAEDKVLMSINGPEGISTAFSRNLLGLPTSIRQGGVTRTYGYNSSNFLTSEGNPETGTISYGRDAVGNMTSRSVGGSGTTTFGYDGLNRLTSMNYPGATPSVTLGYDDNSNLTLVNNGVARRDLTYDANDNLRTERLTVNGLTFNAAYAYNGLDYLSSITYPSLRQVNYSPDALGRPNAVAPYVSSVSHHPNGVPQSLGFANGQTASFGINNRQWISSINTRGLDYAQSLSYSYDGLANVTGIVNGLDAADSKSMSYDGVDRLISAGTASIGYDTADNITSMRTGAGTLSYNYSGNRLTGISGYKSYSFGYDSNGNVTSNGTNTFVYDGASNLRSVGGPTSATYDYDGKNLRVHAQRNGTDIYYFTALDGRLLGEYDSAGVWKKEYAYLGTRLVATVENVPDVAPSAPASITVPTTSTGTHTISWGAATGTVTRYELQQDTSSGFTAPTLAYSGMALSSSVTVNQTGTYYYRVRACNGTACSAYVSGANGVAVSELAPGIPTSLTVPATSSGVYTISWSGPTGAVIHYELLETVQVYKLTGPPQRIAYSGASLTATINKTTLAYPTSYFAGDFDGNGIYNYAVRACNGTVCSDYRYGSNSITVSLPVPAVPGSISVPPSGSGGTFTVSWGSSSGTLTHYELYYATTSDFSNPNPRFCFPGPCPPYLGIRAYVGTGLSFTATGMAAGTYYFRVRACNVDACSNFRTGTNSVVVP